MNINLQQEQKVSFSSKEEIANYFLNQIQEYQNEMSDEEKQKMEAIIQSKLKRGKKLTAEEMEYLRKYNPMLYLRALRIQKMAEAVEARLKNAKSKEEVTQIAAQSIAGISDKDPDKECIVAAINEVVNKFKNSDEYKRLPNTNEEARQRKNKSGIKVKDINENDKENEEFDVDAWSPIQEIVNSLPKFNANA